MLFKKFNESVIEPKKAYDKDGGLDLYVPEQYVLNPLKTAVLGLGIGVKIPKGKVGILVPRSSIAAKGLIIQSSLIDSGYTGEIHLIVTNASSEPYFINKNDRLCSLIVYDLYNFNVEWVEDFEKTERSESGLGSSGR